MVDVASSRQIFDSAVAAVVAHLGTACLPSFLASVHYNYVLALKATMITFNYGTYDDYLLALKVIMMTL